LPTEFSLIFPVDIFSDMNNIHRRHLSLVRSSVVSDVVDASRQKQVCKSCLRLRTCANFCARDMTSQMELFVGVNSKFDIISNF